MNMCVRVEYRVLITNLCTALITTLSLFFSCLPDETSPSCHSSSATCWLRLRPSSLKASFRETPFASPRLTQPSSGGGFSVKSKLSFLTANAVKIICIHSLGRCFIKACPRWLIGDTELSVSWWKCNDLGLVHTLLAAFSETFAFYTTGALFICAAELIHHYRPAHRMNNFLTCHFLSLLCPTWPENLNISTDFVPLHCSLYCYFKHNRECVGK